jgi:hypothetical protein
MHKRQDIENINAGGGRRNDSGPLRDRDGQGRNIKMPGNHECKRRRIQADNLSPLYVTLADLENVIGWEEH